MDFLEFKARSYDDKILLQFFKPFFEGKGMYLYYRNIVFMSFDGWKKKLKLSKFKTLDFKHIESWISIQKYFS